MRATQTPEAVDGQWNRRRFSNKQKQAIVQQTEKPGVSVAQVCRSHGVATSMVFCWLVEFGLTARKAPQPRDGDVRRRCGQ
ncbi:transposase [Bradyrhizobium sp. 33ap4]|uniref:transposase n=1 Tax=Bradyrhizobium sp. 33ap4 TaxID=3061630 RepID=UPI00292F2E5B|nr:transposase [Bradyrhizobium sp. 33ap4]